MNALRREVDEIVVAIAGLDIEVLIEHEPEKRDEPVRAYIISKPLGGTLAVCHNEPGQWVPIYPEKPNYPTKGRWYSPRGAGGHWRDAVFRALQPGNLVPEHIAARCKNLRDPFRAAAAAAIIRRPDWSEESDRPKTATERSHE